MFGPGIDQPIIQYEGTGTTDRRFMSADERGSIIATTNSSGTLLAINRYDEYGKPQSTNSGRFQYTGQMWLSEVGLYYYKARDYLPHLGIFAQSDPIGYVDSLNLYAYVLNDPVNLIDPLGLRGCPEDTTVCGRRLPRALCGTSLNPHLCGTDGSTTAPPASPGGPNVGPGTGTPHDYPLVRRLTKRDTRCTASQVSEAVNQNIVPGNKQHHVNTGQYSVSAGGHEVGTIRFLSNAAGTQFINVTNKGHIFCCGSVETKITGDQRYGFVAHVRGSGVNEPFGVIPSWLMALTNQESGPQIFAAQLQEANMDLLAACGG